MILFIDETDRQEGASGPFFCICSLQIDKDHLLTASNELENIKTKHSLTNLKDSRKTGLTEALRLEIATEVFNCLQKYDVKIRAVVIGESSLGPTKAETYMSAMFFMIERFCLTLKEKSKTGIVVFDSIEEKLARKVSKDYYEHIRTKDLTMYSSYHATLKKLGEYKNYLYPSIFFSDDNHSVLIQAVDLIATSLNSGIVNALKTDKYLKAIKKSELPTHNKFLAIYWPLFMRSPAGRITGWGIKIWD